MDFSIAPEIMIALAVLGGALVAALVIWLLGRKRDSTTEERLRQMLESRDRDLANQIQQLSQQNQGALSELSKVVNDRLDKVSHRMGRSLDETSTKTAKSIGEIQTRLKVIDEAQKNLAELSGDIVGLQDILDNKQARGAFGEIQLNDIVTSALPPDAYSLQTTLSNGCRVDCLIQLPNPPGPIAVDAKFPLESYTALRNAKDDAARKAASTAFSWDITKHVNDIAERYILPGETADTALMFLPSEAVYAELHANFRGVVENGFKVRVMIVSPSTLMATLNTIRAVLKDVRMREQAGVIQKQVGELLKDAVRLDKRVGNLSRHFDLAERDIKEIQTSTGRITRRVDRISKVELEEVEDDEAALIGDAGGPRLVVDKRD